MSGDQRYSWTQPCCPWCFELRHPGRNPYRMTEGRQVETCCFCGVATGEGIYVRVNPTTVEFPQ